MSVHQLSKQLAELGRNGDSVLVHMQPHEVVGLQALAMAQGGSLTVNPHTGMPEAFSLGDFAAALLPTAVGFMVGGPGGAVAGSKLSATAAPILAGAATGAILANAKGEDPLMGGFMGGLGGMGGGDLAKGVTQFGAKTAATTAAPASAAPGTVGSSAGMNAVDTTFPSALGSSADAGNFGFTAGQTPGMTPTSMFGTNTQANAGNLGGMQSFNPSDFTSTPSVAGSQVDGPTFNTLASNTLNKTSNLGGMSQLSSPTQSPFSQGMQSVMDRPMDFLGQKGMAMKVGMPLAMAGLSGIEPSDLGYKPMGAEDKYDPNATLRLSGDTGLRFPRFAMGGPIAFADGGALAGGGIAELNNPYTQSDSQTPPMLSRDGYGLGRLNALAESGQAYADGGDITVNLSTPTGLSDVANSNTGRANYGALSGFSLGMGGANQPYMGMGGMNENYMGMGSINQAYAKGGYLDGPGDGMSDSIPATIEGQQPARLADGEFVVPADVVSHLGNGSTKAGSQRLYGMLDKVRKARTGTKKQGKQINPNKYMPA